MIKNLVANIVASYVSNNPDQTEAVPGLIETIYQALKRASAAPFEEQPLIPAVPIKRSVFSDYIICLEDGKKLKMLKRHLATSFGLTPDGYREKWGLPRDYPMVAPAYASTRSGLAKSIGLGRKRSEPDDITPSARDEDIIPDFAQEPADTAPVTKVKEGQRGKRKRVAEHLA